MNLHRLSEVAFGVLAADFDGDADEDIVYTSGHVHYFPDTGPIERLPGYLENNAGVHFSMPTMKNDFFLQARVGRGLAKADFNCDGKMDFVATDLFSPPRLLLNTTATPAHWLTLELIGVNCPRRPIGAVAEVSIGNYKMLRQFCSGGSYLSQDQPILHFSWPRSTVNDRAVDETVRVSIRWPNGNGSELEVGIPDQHLIIVEGSCSN